MSHTYSSQFFHLIWSTKNRAPLILPSFCKELYQYIGTVIKSEKSVLLHIGGTKDHLHLLVGITPVNSISYLVRIIKSNSSRFVNQLNIVDNQHKKFAWQEGYGSFSVSKSLIDKVGRYIENQEKHHEKFSFEKEYLLLLQKHMIEYDTKYVFG